MKSVRDATLTACPNHANAAKNKALAQAKLAELRKKG
jgi:hypothetical protein